MTENSPQIGARTLLRGLGWDVGVPVVGYYALHLLGVADWPALLVATGLARGSSG